MMKKIFFLLLGLLMSCLVTRSALAQEKRMITLKDGTRVVGEILYFQDNVYTVRSSLGEVQINDQDVVSIASPEAATAAAPKPSLEATTPKAAEAVSPSEDQIAGMQQQLMADPDFMAEVGTIAEDQEIIEALSRPDVLQAVNSRDINAIQSNPELKKLLDNPKFLELIQSASQKVGQPSQDLQEEDLPEEDLQNP